MSRFRGSGDSDTTEASGTVRSSKTPPKKPKKEEAPSEALTCSNGCGFMTRYPNKQALQDKNGKPAKTEQNQYLCPNCQLNGMSSTLKPYP